MLQTDKVNREMDLTPFKIRQDSFDTQLESKDDYINRIRVHLLPNWPLEVIEEWLWRHNDFIDKYSFLDFTKFRFRKVKFSVNEVPGSEVFDRLEMYEMFKDVERRATRTNDWLAEYMYENGTWNTPVILFENSTLIQSLNHPYHLLEGHRRLSFLNGLKSINKANDLHEIWIVKLGDARDRS